MKGEYKRGKQGRNVYVRKALAWLDLSDAQFKFEMIRGNQSSQDGGPKPWTWWRRLLYKLGILKRPKLRG